MSQERGPNLSVTAGGAISPEARVLFGGSTVAAAGVAQDHGTLRDTANASGDVVALKPPIREGSTIMIADGAITAGANVYPAASGKVTATVQGRRIGIAMGAASADGDWIEVLRLPYDADDLEASGVQALTGASMVVTAAMCKNGIVSTSHSTTAGVALPAGKVGMRVTIIKIDANAAAHTISPDGSEKIQGASSFAAVDAQYDSVTLRYSGSATIGWVIEGKHIS